MVGCSAEGGPTSEGEVAQPRDAEFGVVDAVAFEAAVAEDLPGLHAGENVLDDLAARMKRKVKKRWQPQIRAEAKAKAASTGGIVIDTRARMGYIAPVGIDGRGPIHGHRAPGARPVTAC